MPHFHIHLYDDFKEAEHPRGQPDNPGQFTAAPNGTQKSEKSLHSDPIVHNLLKENNFKVFSANPKTTTFMSSSGKGLITLQNNKADNGSLEWNASRLGTQAKGDTIKELQDYISGLSSETPPSSSGGVKPTATSKEEPQKKTEPSAPKEEKSAQVKQDLSNTPDWRNEIEAVKGFRERHDLGLSFDGSMSEKGKVQRAKELDSFMTDLTTRFPKLRNLMSLSRFKISAAKSISGIEGAAMGAYAPFENYIEIASGLKTTESPLRKGKFVVGGNCLQGTIRHELGHALEKKFIEQLQQTDLSFWGGRQWNDVKKEVSRNLSQYAAVNKREYFAEAISAYLHPDFEKSGVKIEPSVKNAFDLILKGKANTDTKDSFYGYFFPYWRTRSIPWW
jgi:hypothetical protein